MINLDIKWSDPIKYDADGQTYYIREWVIPIQYRPHFFSWWKVNKFAMKDKGFAVLKRDEHWVLIESKSNPEAPVQKKRWSRWLIMM
jgi:hypothetical protein